MMNSIYFHISSDGLIPITLIAQISDATKTAIFKIGTSAA
jgi:hypothetical protein